MICEISQTGIFARNSLLLVFSYNIFVVNFRCLYYYSIGRGHRLAKKINQLNLYR